jgi:hypothetical protein
VPRPPSSALAAALSIAAAACSSSTSGTLQIVTGEETDTFSRAPAPTTLEIDSVDSSSGVKSMLGTWHLPASTIDLGSLDQSTIATLQVTGTDANGDRVVYGQSIPIQFGALDGITVPIFVQRTGELARMPGPFSDARPAPTLALFAGGRYLFVGGGSDATLATTTQLYDFASFAPLAGPPPLPRAPESIAFVGTVGLVIDDTGATSFDFSSNTFYDATPMPGGSFGDVAGGATVTASDASQYVVGATRATGAATSAVLAFDTTGVQTWSALGEPRLGAAATWVNGRGVVVAGGSADGAGVEILSPGSTVGSLTSYPADPATGAGAAALDGQHVLLAGGLTPAGDDPGVREVDLTCNADCAPVAWGELPIALSPAQVFASDATDALVVGDDGAGTTHVFRVTPDAAAQEVPTRVAHTGARAIVSPVGSVVLFGGANEMESFVP